MHYIRAKLMRKKYTLTNPTNSKWVYNTPPRNAIRTIQ